VQALESGLGDPFGGGILVEHLQDPAGGNIVGERCQFGKDTGQEIVEPIDRLGGLFDLGLQASGNFTQERHGRRQRRRGSGLLRDGKTGHGLALGIVSGAFGIVRFLVVLVAFGLADRQGHG